MKKSNYFYAVVAVLFFGACNSNQFKKDNISIDAKSETFSIQKELNSISANAEHYSINATTGEQITTTGGARILIAPESFVTKNGEPVSGPIDLSYKEMNSIAEIVASGIPMQANNNGTIGQFVSDGMFEISASSRGEELNVAPGKVLKVFTKSRDKNSTFQYWYFNKSKGIWEETGTRETLANETDIQSEMALMNINSKTGITSANWRWYSGNNHGIQTVANENGTIITPNKMIPGKYDSKKLTLDLEFNLALYPELAGYSSLMWQFAGSDLTEDPARNNWIFQTAWNNVKLEPIAEKPGFFNLSMDAGGKPFHTVVRPVVQGNDYEKAKEEYGKQLVNLEKERTRILNEGASADQITKNLYNAFQVSRMGVFNCDRFYSDVNAKEYTASFELDGKAMDPERMIYIVTDRRTGVIQYTAKYYKMRFNPRMLDAIFVVAANGTIAAVNASGIHSIKEGNGGKVHLVFENVKTKIKDLGSLKEAIDNL
ncbi:MAG: hypothetical protein KG003_06810 [Bacteroidetes bacterium]|nr:hypothetical protein [Bacteroidota bacterium]